MAEDQGKEEEKFDFTREGEAVGYISSAQARLLAVGTARDTLGEYGGSYQGIPMVFETVEARVEEDYYRIRVSYRPITGFDGTPGEVFTGGTEESKEQTTERSCSPIRGLVDFAETAGPSLNPAPMLSY